MYSRARTVKILKKKLQASGDLARMMLNEVGEKEEPLAVSVVLYQAEEGGS